MTLVTLDVVLLLPPQVRSEAVRASAGLARRMLAEGSASGFRLGEAYPGFDDAPCEPHVSLFMLGVTEAEVTGVVSAVQRLAGSISPVRAVGEEYRHNPVGAPELYFEKAAAWVELQRAVVAEVEPLRRGRLRELDPAGERIDDLLASLPVDDPRRQQLVRYGYDEIAEPAEIAAGPGDRDRFNPHVTLAWPLDPESRVSLGELPSPAAFTAELTELAVFGMRPHGTCTTNYGTFQLSGGS